MNSLVQYTLHLADNALILGQRNAEWCGHGPVLEQDIAITNISLDLIGQARNFYQYAAGLLNQQQLSGADLANVAYTEDKLAYLRSEREYKNCLLVELPRGDWAQTIIRQFLFSNYQFFFYTELRQRSNDQLAAIAEKALKEVTYHLRWSSEWVIRLGDGTAESHARAQNALHECWPYTGELLTPADYEMEMAASTTGVDLSGIKNSWEQNVKAVLTEATLQQPAGIWMHRGGKNGKHTEHLGFMLAEMQYMQRAYPGNEW